jgi:hypothetical protein
MSNLFYVRYSHNMMFWELLKIARYVYVGNKHQFPMLASWRNSRNDWFKKVLYDD